MVVAYHGRFGLDAGFSGVDVFFVISGFVISGVLLRELEQTRRLSILGFYARRVKRLLPGLAMMLTVVALAGMLLAPIAAVHMSALTGMAASVFGANWYLGSLPHGYFDPSASLDPLLHTWTLGVEEQFYLVYPVLLWGAWRVGRRVGAAVAVSVVGAGSVALAFAWPGQLAFYGSPARAWEFLLGCLIALGSRLWMRLPRLASAALASVGVAGVIAAALGGEGTITQNQAPAAVGAALLIVAGSRTNVLSELLSVRPLVWIGDLSYSWYLWHWPLVVFAGAVWPESTNAVRIAAVTSLAVATASYKWVEKPVRYAPEYVGPRLVALAATLVMLPIIAGAVQLNVSLTSQIAYAGALHADVRRHCDRSDPLGSPMRRDCEWNVPHARGRIVLIGDSNAGQFTEPVTAAGNQLGYDVTVATFSSCPFVPLRVFENGGEASGCERFNRLSLLQLERRPPSLVVISMRADDWIEDSAKQLAATRSSAFSANEGVKSRLWSHALRSELTALARATVHVIVVEPLPVGPTNEPNCAVVLVMTDRCGVANQSRTLVDRELHAGVSSEQAAASELADVQLLDLEGLLCTHSSCSSIIHNVQMYRDKDHLSIAGSRMLTRSFARAIRGALRASGPSTESW